MAQNPLQQFFRQPKIFIGLPSQGIYNKPTTIQGDPARIAVYGMTGMDEIVMKTPDALLSGDSTAQVIQSCCPDILDAWDISVLDVNTLLTAIRIATFGSELSVNNTCSACKTVNSYDINLNNIIDHFTHCSYENKLVLKELTIITKPLTYKQSSLFSLKNFEMQQTLKQLETVTDAEQRKELMTQIFHELSTLRTEVFTTGIESVDTGTQIVTERQYIKEWIENSDTTMIQSISDHIEMNRDNWDTPGQTVKCENCGHEESVSIDLDQSNFFVKA